MQNEEQEVEQIAVKATQNLSHYGRLIKEGEAFFVKSMSEAKRLIAMGLVQLHTLEADEDASNPAKPGTPNADPAAATNGNVPAAQGNPNAGGANTTPAVNAAAAGTAGTVPTTPAAGAAQPSAADIANDPQLQ
jgi:hypothetical protein